MCILTAHCSLLCSGLQSLLTADRTLKRLEAFIDHNKNNKTIAPIIFIAAQEMKLRQRKTGSSLQLSRRNGDACWWTLVKAALTSESRAAQTRRQTVQNTFDFLRFKLHFVCC